MAVQLERCNESGGLLNHKGGSAAKKGGTSWNGIFQDYMEPDGPYSVTRTLAASVNKKYKSGSYNREPLIPPIINPPAAVTQRGPDAPYYDARLTGGPLIRPDARLYTYDTAPSYIRAIIDYSYGAPKGAKTYEKDSEYRETYADLASGKGYKGHFMSPGHPDYWKEWEDYFVKVAQAASKNNTATLGAYVTRDEVSADADERIREQVAQALAENPDQTAIVIDGDIIMVPKAASAQQGTQADLMTDMVWNQLRMGGVLQPDAAAYARRLSELGLDTAIGI